MSANTSTPQSNNNDSAENDDNENESSEYLSEDSNLSYLFNESQKNIENMEELREQLEQTQRELETLRNANETNGNRAVQTHAVAELKVQQFYENDPELWFVTIEAQFESRKITKDKTKYNSVIANLNYKAASQVKSILQSEYYEGKYKMLKDALIESFSATSTERIKQLLSNEQLGDSKPSQLLDKMKLLAGKSISEEFIKNLWIQRLPETPRQVLSASSDKTEILANMADRMWESANYSSINAIEKFENEKTNEKAKIPTLQSISEQLEKICKRLRDVESKNRSRDSTPSKPHNRSRSQSNKRNDNTDEMCWYHKTLGDAAKKCRTPCNFKQQQKN